MSWLKKAIPPKIKNILGKVKKNIPEGLWQKCPSCQTVLYGTDLEKNNYVCPNCNFHHRIDARKRLSLLLDTPGQQELGKDIKPKDPLGFKDSKTYKERIKSSQKTTDENDALITVKGHLESINVVIACFEFKFMGGSMGSVVGEKFVNAVNTAVDQKCPFICISASGGARMQEGLMSLFQMSKTSASLTKLSAIKQPFISVLTDPTMGGVSASFAMLGDIIIAEPKALIGFAGPRVIEQTVREKLPEGFQTSEFLLTHGAIDMIVDRRQLRKTLTDIIVNLKN